jgi:hypothetical protein
VLSDRHRLGVPSLATFSLHICYHRSKTCQRLELLLIVTASGGDHLTDKERSPPARPIELEFPNYVPPKCGSPLDQKHLQTVCQSLASIRRLTDIQDAHLGHLNVQAEQEVPLSALIADDRFKERPLLFDNDLTAMLTELETDNEDAYREIFRIPPLEGRKKPKLAYSRNFFASLEDMSRYWDNSKDHYYEVDITEPEEPNEVKRPGAQAMGSAPTSNAALTGSSQTTQATSEQREIKSPTSTGETSTAGDSVEMPTRPKKKEVYRGQRLGNGEQMSPGTRVGTVRNLIKMAIHKFNCRDYDVSPREKLRIQNINVPSVSYNFCVAKLPADPKVLRARMVEGPLMAVYCRNEVRFKPRNEVQGPTSDFLGEKFDFFREIGGMLMLALQRARSGQTPSNEPRDDQWWATKSRWGGGETKWGQLASEVFEDEDPSWSPEERRLQLDKRESEEAERIKAEAATGADLKSLQPDDLMADALTSSSERPKKKKKSGEDGAALRNKVEYKDGRKLIYVPPVRRKWYQEWLKIRPNGPSWDEKLICRAVGKSTKEGSASGWDEIFMVSSVNHHACILKMKVHDKYLQWLKTGDGGKETLPQSSTTETASDQFHILYVSRSPWFDLFDVEQRKELLIGMWRILSWINRDEVPQEEMVKMEELKKHGQQAEEVTEVQMKT